jgi:hypothetical protein
VSSALEHVPRPKTIRGARFTARERLAAAPIAASYPLNSAWPLRGAWQLLPAKYAICASTRTASGDASAKALSLLSARSPNWLRHLGGRNPPYRHCGCDLSSSGNRGKFTAILRASYLMSNFAAEIDLAVAFSGANSSPKAKGNGRPDHERDHNCVPQRHDATDQQSCE